MIMAPPGDRGSKKPPSTQESSEYVPTYEKLSPEEQDRVARAAADVQRAERAWKERQSLEN